jgi:ribonuclease-3
MHNQDTKNLEVEIGYSFTNQELLVTALTHRSFLNEQRLEFVGNNERLEFLGDAVLELVTTELLFHTYPGRPEGELTSFRAALVRTESLAETAEVIGIGQFIRMSKGEEATGGRTRQYILANSIEALIGAIYLDSGYKQAKKFVDTFIGKKLTAIVEQRLDIDAKSKLQEIAQEKFKYTPTYEVSDQQGPDHDRVFTVRAIINGENYGEGQGKSKQEAQQAAAKEALSKITNL